MPFVITIIAEIGVDIMMEFGITNYKTGETDVMYGHNVMDAFQHSGKDMIDWVVDWVEFID